MFCGIPENTNIAVMMQAIKTVITQFFPFLDILLHLACNSAELRFLRMMPGYISLGTYALLQSVTIAMSVWALTIP
jgi:hypothetical protein